MKLHTLLFITLFCSVFSLSAQDKYGLQVGDEVPEFQFVDAANQSTKSADLKGKVLMVNFFATWCGPCRQELPMLESRIWDKYKDSTKFQLMCFGRGHNQKEIDKFKATNLYDLPMYTDVNEGLYNLFASRYIPRTFIIDKKGFVAYISVGFNKNDFDEMVKAIDVLMKE